MPITGLSADFLVQVMEPIAMIPVIHRVSVVRNVVEVAQGRTLEDIVKNILLETWHKDFKSMPAEKLEALRSSDGAWMLEVDSVELIPCELLVPVAPKKLGFWSKLFGKENS